MVRRVAKGILAGLIGGAVAAGAAGCRSGAVDAAVTGAAGGSATVSWSAPTVEADGSTPLRQLDGYRLHYGPAPRRYTDVIDVGNVTEFTVTHLAPGTYFFAVTAYNSGGESAPSAEGSKAIR